jgi:hypothetical protein
MLPVILGAAPVTTDYLAAVLAAFWCDLILLAGTFVLALRLPMPRGIPSSG